MISLTYLSTATAPFSSSELDHLLRAAREANLAAAVTGMLLYAGGHFIQTLEGAEDVVDATFARIDPDPRHRDVFITLREEIESRNFPHWSMGFESLSTEQAAALPGFNDYLDTATIALETDRDQARAGIFHRVFRDNMR